MQTKSWCAPSLNRSSCSCVAGRGLELFSAVFEPQADSAWLKCLILKFCLVAQSSLHEAGPSLSSSESSESVTPQQDQQSEANNKPRKATQPTPSSKMPSTNHKALSKKQKQKQNSRAAVLANRHTDSPKPAASTASKEEHTASVRFNSQCQSKKLMAVPAASEDQAAGVNGFSAQSALGAPSPEGMYADYAACSTTLPAAVAAAVTASCSGSQTCSIKRLIRSCPVMHAASSCRSSATLPSHQHIVRPKDLAWVALFLLARLH